MKTFSMGGVHPADNKISCDAAIENFPIPQTAYISMSQHLGAPAEPIVAVGDKVKVGQLIANASGFISAPVHSSVSGTVKSIETVKDIAGNPCKAVVITVEGDEWSDTIDRSEDIVREIKLDSKQIVERIKECGVVGLGGATFPTCVKLSPPPGKKAEFLIINGAECEPYLTSDYRVLVEMPEQVLIGASIMMKALNVSKGFIGIEENKPKAIEILNGYAAQYPDIKVVISGSSLLHILNADADLSRRCIKYTMSGLSFREFLRFYRGIEIRRTNIGDIIENPAPLCSEVNNLCKPVEQFKEYLAYGYYPFYIEDSDNYYTRIEQVTNFVIETELPLLRRVDVANVRKIKALISIIASNIPFELDASKLSRAIGTGRDTVVEYLKHLEDARIFNLLYSDVRSVGKLTRPDKIYLENPNLLYALSSNEVNIGTARETFVVNQLKNRYTIEYGRKQGDFKVEGTYTFEVGGKDKAFSQIAGIQNSFVLSDDMETPVGRKLPIWIIGFVS